MLRPFGVRSRRFRQTERLACIGHVGPVLAEVTGPDEAATVIEHEGDGEVEAEAEAVDAQGERPPRGSTRVRHLMTAWYRTEMRRQER